MTKGAFGGLPTNADNLFVMKLASSNGALVNDFGQGDGGGVYDNDGIRNFSSIGGHPSTSEEDNILAMTIDANDNLYLGGFSVGSFGGINAGGSDAILTKLYSTTGLLDYKFGSGDGGGDFDSDGVLQLNDINTNSASSLDHIEAVVHDGNGSIFVAGFTYSSLGGELAGVCDGFIAKINSTTGALDTSFGNGDGGGVYNNDGIVQLNASNTNSALNFKQLNNIAIDTSGNIYVTGYTDGSLGGVNTGGQYDVFIVKLDPITGILDTNFGSGDGIPGDGIVQINNINSTDASNIDSPSGLAIDSVNGFIFVGGTTKSNLGGGISGVNDSFVAKLDYITGLLSIGFGNGDGGGGYDSDGILQFNAISTNQIAVDDSVSDIVIDDVGNIYVIGDTDGVLGGVAGGARDIYVAKLSTATGVFDGTFGSGDGGGIYDSDGIFQINATNANDTTENDWASAIILDGNGNIFIAGSTEGDLGGINAVVSSWAKDAIVIKLSTTTGALDVNFGNGDGGGIFNNDGILQINNANATNPGSTDYFTSIAIDSNDVITAAGATLSSLTGSNGSGSTDGFTVRINATSGLLEGN